MWPRARDRTGFGAVAESSAIEFLIARDHSRGFFFAQGNVDGFWNSCSSSNRVRTLRLMPADRHCQMLRDHRLCI